MGLKGELEPTLEMFKEAETTTVLGLRDVMDSPRLLAAEWNKSNMIDKVEEYYDRVWVYGPERSGIRFRICSFPGAWKTVSLIQVSLIAKR